MTKSQLDLMIKRTNQRLVSIGQTFGTGSKIYKDEVAKFSRGDFIENTHKIKSGKNKGIIQLNRGSLSSLYSNPNNRTSYSGRLFASMLNSVKTISQIFRKTKQETGITDSDFKKLSSTEKSRLARNVYNKESQFKAMLSELYNQFTQEEIESVIPGLYGNEGLDSKDMNSIIRKGKKAVKNAATIKAQRYTEFDTEFEPMFGPSPFDK